MYMYVYTSDSYINLSKCPWTPSRGFVCLQIMSRVRSTRIYNVYDVRGVDDVLMIACGTIILVFLVAHSSLPYRERSYSTISTYCKQMHVALVTYVQAKSIAIIDHCALRYHSILLKVFRMFDHRYHRS